MAQVRTARRHDVAESIGASWRERIGDSYEVTVEARGRKRGKGWKVCGRDQSPLAFCAASREGRPWCSSMSCGGKNSPNPMELAWPEEFPLLHTAWLVVEFWGEMEVLEMLRVLPACEGVELVDELGPVRVWRTELRRMVG